MRATVLAVLELLEPLDKRRQLGQRAFAIKRDRVEVSDLHVHGQMLTVFQSTTEPLDDCALIRGQAIDILPMVPWHTWIPSEGGWCLSKVYHAMSNRNSEQRLHKTGKNLEQMFDGS
jgi:hypothetical protein